MRVRTALGGGRGIVKPEMAWQYCYELDSALLLYHNSQAFMLKPFCSKVSFSLWRQFRIG